jgi:hypothetical protein
MVNQWHPYLIQDHFTSPIDFYARRVHFIDHIAPVWNELKSFSLRGKFYVHKNLVARAESWGCTDVIGLDTPDELLTVPPGRGPVVCAAQGDLIQASKGKGRPYILFEHGVGLIFPRFSGYAGGLGMRRYVGLFLAPNQVVYNKTAATFPQAFQAIVGTPKLDEWAHHAPKEPEVIPTIAISFHWDGKAVCPEAGTAWEHYKNVVSQLGQVYHVLGHGHPRSMDYYAPIWESMGFEVVRDFREVMERADVYVNDCSSTLYEFLVTKRPVVIMNAPWFSKKVNYGIRFWDYTDIGPQVEQPEDLLPTVAGIMKDDMWYCQREDAVKALYPNVGVSAKIAAEAIVKFYEGMADGTITYHR